MVNKLTVEQLATFNQRELILNNGMNIVNGSFEIKFVYEESDFGVPSAGKITLTSLVHYVPVGTIVLFNTLVVPTDGLVTISPLGPMPGSTGNPTTGNALICLQTNNIAFEAAGNNLNTGSLVVQNLLLATTSDTMTFFSMKSTAARNGNVLLDSVLVSGGRAFDTDNISVLTSGIFFHAEPDLSSKFNVTDSLTGGVNPVETIDFDKYDIAATDNPAIANLSYIEVFGKWGVFSINGGFMDEVKSGESLFDIDSGAVFVNAFNVRGLNATILSGGSVFAVGSLDQTTLSFSGNTGVPNSKINGNMKIAAGTGTVTVTIAATSTPVIVNNTNADLNNFWDFVSSERFTFDQALGRLTFNGVATSIFVIASCTIGKVGGGVDIISGFIAKNGTVIPESEQRTDSANPAGITCVALVSLVNGDFLEFAVQNASDTSNITIDLTNFITQNGI